MLSRTTYSDIATTTSNTTASNATITIAISTMTVRDIDTAVT